MSRYTREIHTHASELRAIAESLSDEGMRLRYLLNALATLAEVHEEDHDELGELARNVLVHFSDSYGVQECFPLLDPNVPEGGSRYPDKGCYRVGCPVHGGPGGFPDGVAVPGGETKPPEGTHG